MTDAKRRERNAAKQAARRARRAAERQAEALAEAQRLEAREREDELAAPAVTRSSIILPDGSILIGARIQVVDGRPAHVDPLANLKLSREHRRAGYQLLADWREVGGGIGPAAVDYNRSRGSGDGDGIHEAIGAQIATRARLEGALTYAGAFVPCLSRLIFDAVPLASWAMETDKTIEEAKGWFRAALDRLAQFYTIPDRVRTLDIGDTTVIAI